MIICPNCGNKEIPGSLFCQECGNQLFTISREPTVAIPSSLSGQFHEYVSDDIEQNIPPTPDDANLSLFLVDIGEVITLQGLNEYTIGRSSEDQPILPDIDLAPYHGYE